MKVIIICEFSGRVRDAFIKHGHDATSCDLLDTEVPGPHIKDDCRNLDYSTYDLVIAHPPCTHLAASGAGEFYHKGKEQAESLEFIRWILDLPVKSVALENPIGIISSQIRKPDQIIQPWMFGEGETKATCLWLKGLPRLKATNEVDGRVPRVHYESPGPERWKNRSRTYQGIADAMAQQWGNELNSWFVREAEQIKYLLSL